jgi:hypothetical protein
MTKDIELLKRAGKCTLDAKDSEIAFSMETQFMQRRYLSAAQTALLMKIIQRSEAREKAAKNESEKVWNKPITDNVQAPPEFKDRMKAIFGTAYKMFHKD